MIQENALEQRKKHGLEFNPELVLIALRTMAPQGRDILKLFQFGLDNRNFSIFSFTYK